MISIAYHNIRVDRVDPPGRRAALQRAGQESEAGDRDHPADAAHRDGAGPRAGEQADRDAAKVQQPGAHHEVRRRRRPGSRPAASRCHGRSRGRWRRSRPSPRRSRAAGARPSAPRRRGPSPRRRCRSRSTISARRRAPSAPPIIITSGKVIGSSQIAGAPRKAPQRPTATIAATWSGPVSGCRNPVRNPPPAAWPGCAEAAVAKPSSMTTRAVRRTESFTGDLQRDVRRRMCNARPRVQPDAAVQRRYRAYSPGFSINRTASQRPRLPGLAATASDRQTTAPDHGIHLARTLNQLKSPAAAGQGLALRARTANENREDTT